jgi:GT2 family glycosyltransferase
MDKIAIVILNWNGQHFLEQFLPSVQIYSKEATVYIADNGSTDHSIEFVKNNYPEIKIVQLPDNYGFCGGYNKALAQIDAEYYVILNSDVEVTPNWLKAPISYLDKYKDVAACQPKIKSHHDKRLLEHAGAAGGFIDILGFPFCRGRVFLEVEKDQDKFNDTIEVFWASGAALIIRAKVFHETGGFDPDFFAHMEEIDLCWRMKNAGYRIVYCGASEIYHVGGGTLPNSNPRKTFLNFRNGLALLLKNLPLHLLFPILLIRMILDGVAALQFFLVGYPKDAFAIFRAHLSFYANFFRWFGRRTNVPAALPTQMIRKSIVWEHFILRKNKYK